MNIIKTSSMLVCVAALFGTKTFAAHYDLTSTLSAGYDLPTKETQIFSGSWFHTSNLACKVRTSGGDNHSLTVLAMKHRIIINGTILSEGKLTSVLVRAGDKINFEIDPRGKLGLTNNSEELVNLLCS